MSPIGTVPVARPATPNRPGVENGLFEDLLTSVMMLSMMAMKSYSVQGLDNTTAELPCQHHQASCCFTPTSILRKESATRRSYLPTVLFHMPHQQSGTVYN